MKKILFLYLLIFTYLNSIKSFSQIESFEKEKISIVYGLYYLENDITDLQTVKNTIKDKYPSLVITDSIDENILETQVIIYETKKILEDHLPQDIETLNFFGRGLNENQKKSLQNSSYLISLVFLINKHEVLEKLEKINTLVLDIIENKNVIIFDPETRESFTKEYWKENRFNNSSEINKHITIHFYQNEKRYCRGITLGMYKYGLPDISINNVSCTDGNRTKKILILLAQTLLENNYNNNLKEEKLSLDINSIKNNEVRNYLNSTLFKNAQNKTTITIGKGIWEEGDPNNDIIEINFPEKNPQIQQNEAFNILFGDNEQVVTITHNDELINASNKAKNKIPELYKKFSNTLPKNSSLSMKFYFENEEGDGEWMWVEIIKWNKNTVTGLLDNNPYIITDLKLGQEVTKNVNDMFDYILYLPDGTQEGNETGKIIEKMSKN